MTLAQAAFQASNPVHLGMAMLQQASAAPEPLPMIGPIDSATAAALGLSEMSSMAAAAAANSASSAAGPWPTAAAARQDPSSSVLDTIFEAAQRADSSNRK